MPIDLLVLAGKSSEILERHGFVACGRRQDGVARVDFWTPNGEMFRYELRDESATVEAVVAACLAMAGSAKPEQPPVRVSPLN